MTTVTVCAPLSLDPTSIIEATTSAAGQQVSVLYRPDLLPPQRFPADHRGADDFVRTQSAERQWQNLLADTEIAFGVPQDGPAGLAQLVKAAPGLRWVQGTAAGTGEMVASAGLDAAALSRLVVTSAAGIHAVPLAEFAMFGLLAFAKDLDVLTAANAVGTWLPRWPMRLLSGSHVVVVGLGGVGAETARLAAAFGARVTGVRRRLTGETPAGVDQVVELADLPNVLRTADFLVLTLPGTPRTRELFGEELLAALPPHAVLVNVGRGSVVVTSALVKALDSGALRGAVLDVAEVEPLPTDSALWHRPNVIISPHTAALTANEDDRLTALFADNLVRLLEGRPLRNVVDTSAGY